MFELGPMPISHRFSVETKTSLECVNMKEDKWSATMRDWLPFRQFPLRIASVERSIAIPSLLKWAMDDMTLEIWVASTEGESTISLFLPEQSGHRGSGLPSESPEATSSFDVVLTHKIRRVSLEYFTLSRSLGCLDWNWSSVPEYCRDSSWEVGLKTKKKFSC